MSNPRMGAAGMAGSGKARRQEVVVLQLTRILDV